ncbi:MAG: UDP-N-acetyl-D-galactosamine dehydrogenase [Novosphingobium sp. 28-62-57]|uniref:nucleotide sugar dehydrogenase n=1 Tax=unclassified Novosphingobium TaxID=2644732 RepID=UPI000BD18F34|nr:MULTISPECIES: nucleotide sugar dehydrogenase [unclassified Novosphingobium]OYW48405.1 MAG: UDP-N-acetyl-D-galactosamine dehydrogenase [Novosphingobium sp. 12-62-10]OYZ09268.1 MAG: UDP-N-acetyl-D-galactosamine dehydrogenase [Novosphingobium sp. 28-62-57]
MTVQFPPLAPASALGLDPLVSANTRVVVLGLGYVGLPLAVALAKQFFVTGFDIDTQRIGELSEGHDRTREIDAERLAQSSLGLISDANVCPPSDFYIVTVPTPIDAANRPDLRLVEAASRTVGKMLPAAVAEGRCPVVVYESTVYPGVTEDICGPILEQVSGLKCGVDFFLGYSPERINPGDREHTIDKITKVVSGQNPEVLERVADLYGAITSGGVFRAASIKAAEAAKVIENAQRDINIAFMNEITQIFSKMDLSVWDVLAAAGTKWNFLPFTPGLVGGHCIGVDPYYLSARAEALGHDPQVILAGRGVNDGMAKWLAGELHAQRGGKPGSVLVLGLTFKENVPDLRNSKVADVIAELQALGHQVAVHDPHADGAEALLEYGLHLAGDAFEQSYDLVFLAVPHKYYLAAGAERIAALVAPGGTLADLKGVLGARADWRL